MPMRSCGGLSVTNDEYDDQCFEHEDDDYDSSEPIGSCDECATNLYEDDAYVLPDGTEVCGQCLWYMTGGRGL